MSGFLLDTKAWIALLKNNLQVVEGVRHAGIDALYLCAPGVVGIVVRCVQQPTCGREPGALA
jgi:hypothetical protein